MRQRQLGNVSVDTFMTGVSQVAGFSAGAVFMQNWGALSEHAVSPADSGRLPVKIFVGDPPTYLYPDSQRPATDCSPMTGETPYETLFGVELDPRYSCDHFEVPNATTMAAWCVCLFVWLGVWRVCKLVNYDACAGPIGCSVPTTITIRVDLLTFMGHLGPGGHLLDYQMTTTFSGARSCTE